MDLIIYVLFLLFIYHIYSRLGLLSSCVYFAYVCEYVLYIYIYDDVCLVGVWCGSFGERAEREPPSQPSWRNQIDIRTEKNAHLTRGTWRLIECDAAADDDDDAHYDLDLTVAMNGGAQNPNCIYNNNRNAIERERAKSKQ